MSREVRWLARELRPMPAHRRWPWWVRLAGWLLRHVPELAVVVLVVLVVRALVDRFGPVWTPTLAGLVAAGLVAWSRSRRWLTAGLGCLVTRYRLRTSLRELRLTARSGRRPAVLWLTPTPVGERVWLLCPAGVSAEDIADETDRIRSACYARDVRVVRDPRWSALVTVEVIRRDTLATTAKIPTPLVDVLDAVPLPRQEVPGHG